MTHLPEMIAHLDIDLPSIKDPVFAKLGKVKRLAWMVLLRLCIQKSLCHLITI